MKIKKELKEIQKRIKKQKNKIRKSNGCKGNKAKQKQEQQVDIKNKRLYLTELVFNIKTKIKNKRTKNTKQQKDNMLKDKCIWKLKRNVNKKEN